MMLQMQTNVCGEGVVNFYLHFFKKILSTCNLQGLDVDKERIIAAVAIHSPSFMH